MKNILLLLLLIAYLTDTDGHSCSRPEVKRKMVDIYRAMSIINVKVIKCLYNDSVTVYYDISNNCLSASANGIFTDKYNDVYNIKKFGSPVVLEEYLTKADFLKNEIWLRSGTICRYDRGFCYDPKEAPSYAVVWNISHFPKEKLLDKLELIFSGFVDFWNFTSNNLTYMFYYETNLDKSFTLRLSQSLELNKSKIWLTDEDGYIVSPRSLFRTGMPVKSNRNFFSLKSKRFVTEAILKDCDLRSNTEFSAEYLVDPENLQVILERYQGFLQNYNNSVTEIDSCIKNLDKIQSLAHTNSVSPNSNSLWNKTVELEVQTKYLYSTSQRLSLELNALMKNVNDLRNTTNYSIIKILQEKLVPLQNELDQKFLKFKDFYEKNHISFLQMKDYILDKLNPQLEAIGKSSDFCLVKIKNVETDSSTKISEIKNLASNTISSIEKKVEKWNTFIVEKVNLSNIRTKEIESRLNFLQDKSSQYEKMNNEKLYKMEESNKYNIQSISDTAFRMENKLGTKINSIFLSSDKCLNDLTRLKQSMDSFTKLSISDLNKLNVTFTEKSQFFEGKIEYLSSLVEGCKNVQNNFKDFTETKIIDVINNVLKSNKNYIDDIEHTLIEKFNPIIEELNRERKTVSDKVNDIKQDIDGNIENEISKIRLNIEDIQKILNQTKIADIGSRIDNEIKRLDGFISTTDHYAKQFEFELLALKNQFNSQNLEMHKFSDDVHKTFEDFSKDYSNAKSFYTTELNNLKYNTIQEIVVIKNRLNTATTDISNVGEQFQSVNKTLAVLEASINNYEKTEKGLLNITEKNILQKLEPIILSVTNKTTKYQEETKKFTIAVQEEIKNVKQHIAESLIWKVEIGKNITSINNSLSNNEIVTNALLKYLEYKIDQFNLKMSSMENNLQYVSMNTSKMYNATQDNKHLVTSIESRLSDLSTNVGKIEKAFVEIKSEQIESINQSLKINNITMGKVIKVLTILTDKTDTYSVQANTLEGKILSINTNLSSLEESVASEKINNLKRLNDYTKLKTEFENNKQQLRDSEQSLKKLNQNIIDSNIEHSKYIVEIIELKKEMQEMKNENRKKEELFNTSLKNMSALLNRKDDEITAIKSEIKRIQSCCDHNTNDLLKKTDDLIEIKTTFIKNITSLQEEFEKLINKAPESE